MCVQLPPIAPGGGEGRFVFETDVFRHFEKTVVLQQIYRQSNPLQQRVLNELRCRSENDEICEEAVGFMTGRGVMYGKGQLGAIKNLMLPVLAPTNAQVQEINAFKLHELTSDAITFTALDTGTLLTFCLYPNYLALFHLFLLPLFFYLLL